MLDKIDSFAQKGAQLLGRPTSVTKQLEPEQIVDRLLTDMDELLKEKDPLRKLEKLSLMRKALDTTVSRTRALASMLSGNQTVQSLNVDFEAYLDPGQHHETLEQPGALALVDNAKPASAFAENPAAVGSTQKAPAGSASAVMAAAAANAGAEGGSNFAQNPESTGTAQKPPAGGVKNGSDAQPIVPSSAVAQNLESAQKPAGDPHVGQPVWKAAGADCSDANRADKDWPEDFDSFQAVLAKDAPKPTANIE